MRETTMCTMGYTYQSGDGQGRGVSDPGLKAQP